MNYEALNEYVLIALGLFAVLLYFALTWVGLSGFLAGVSKAGQNKKRYARGRTRRLRNAKRPN